MSTEPTATDDFGDFDDVDDVEQYQGLGTCPTCRRYDGYINIGRAQWFYCVEHKTCWIAGSNLFSGWRGETEADQQRVYDELDFGSFAYVAGDEQRPHGVI